MIVVKILRRYCKGCGLCVEACGEGKLSIATHPDRKGVRPAIVREDIDCTGCLKCTTICPDAAIEIFRVGERGESDGEDASVPEVSGQRQVCNTGLEPGHLA